MENEVDKDASKPSFNVIDRRFWAAAAESQQDEEPARKPSLVEQLEQQIAERENKLAQLREKHEAALSEFANAKARLDRELSKELQAYKRHFVADLLEVLDNLDMALQAAQAASDASSILEGVVMVRDQFIAKLEAQGIQRADSLHHPFDPTRHEAISIIPVEDPTQDGIVLGVVKEAYLMGEETIRPGMVAVGRA